MPSYAKTIQDIYVFYGIFGQWSNPVFHIYHINDHLEHSEFWTCLKHFLNKSCFPASTWSISQHMDHMESVDGWTSFGRDLIWTRFGARVLIRGLQGKRGLSDRWQALALWYSGRGNFLFIRDPRCCHIQHFRSILLPDVFWLIISEKKNPALKLETLRPENNGLEGVVQRRDMGPSKTNQTNHADESRSPKNTYRHSFSMEFLSILAQIKNHQTPSILSNVLETPGNKQGVLDNPV